MTPTVTLFQSVQKYYQSMGIYPTLPNEKYSFNWMSFLILISMLVIFIPSTAFFFLKAETNEENYNTLYVSSSVLTYIGCFIINIWKITKVRELIAIAENSISKSKLYFLNFFSFWVKFSTFFQI